MYFKKRGERGYTLLIVLWVMVILGLIFSSLIEEIQLNNNLLEHRLCEQNIRELVVSGVNLAVARLKADKTPFFDTVRDNWYKKIEGNKGRFEYEIRIEDAAAKINVNYCPEELLKRTGCWNQDLLKLRSQELIAESVFLEGCLGDDCQDVDSYLTVYGKYNLNSDPVEGLRRLLRFLG